MPYEIKKLAGYYEYKSEKKIVEGSGMYELIIDQKLIELLLIV